MHIGQAEIPACMTVSQSFVVETHQMQHRGVPVVDVHPTFDGFIAVFIGAAVTESAFNTAASHPGCVALVIMITTMLGQ